MSTKRSTPSAEPHKWEFKARFRRHAFGWKSQPAITRIKQAVTEIKKVAKKEPVLAAEGAIAFLERVSPALEHVDSSSGSIGTAVGNAIAELVPIIASAPADATCAAPGSSDCSRRIGPISSRTSSGSPTTGASCARRRRSPPHGRTSSSASRSWR
jgi:hypothetical protein